MRIAIIGPGGVGGLLAGLLHRAGHSVSLVARGASLAAIEERGLQIDSSLGNFTARVAVTSDARSLDVEATLLAVKAWQVPGLPLPPRGLVVPLQNGVEAVDQLAELGNDRLVGGLCHMISQIVEPGVIRHVGAPPKLTLAAHPGVEPLRSALAEAGAEVTVTGDYPAALWSKFLFIASFGGVGALARTTAGVLRTTPETRALLTRAFEEVRAVATAKGVTLASDVVEKTLAFVDTLPEAATSSLQRDIVAGRPSELEALSGAVVRIARAHGVAVPVHETIYAALLPQRR